MYNPTPANYYQPMMYNQNSYPNVTYPNNYTNQNKSYQQYQDNKQNDNTINLVYVNGYESAKDVILQPNQRVWIMNTNCQEFYIKTSDGMGVSTLDCYEFTKFDPKTREINGGKQTTIDYVKRDEFDILKSKIEALEKNMSIKPKLNKKADD